MGPWPGYFVCFPSSKASRIKNVTKLNKKSRELSLDDYGTAAYEQRHERLSKTQGKPVAQVTAVIEPDVIKLILKIESLD